MASMGSSETDAVVHSCAGLHTQLDVLEDGKHATEQRHGPMPCLQPSYESTYLKVHKQELDRLRSFVQRPEPGTFMHTDLMWQATSA